MVERDLVETKDQEAKAIPEDVQDLAELQDQVGARVQAAAMTIQEEQQS